MDADRTLELGGKELDAGGYVSGDHGAGRIGEVHDVRAVALHELGLLEQLLRADHVRSHQEAHDLHAQRFGKADVLLGDVRLRAVGSNAHHLGAAVARSLQIRLRADPRDQQHGQLAVLQNGRDRVQVVAVVRGREPVVERRAAQAVAV